MNGAVNGTVNEEFITSTFAYGFEFLDPYADLSDTYFRAEETSPPGSTDVISRLVRG